MASRAPAITPDVRSTMRKKGTTTKKSSDAAAAADSSKKVVSFGLFTSKNNSTSNANSSTTTATKDEIHITKEEAIRQYKLYRSSPTSFPSYDRIQLVKLPNEYLPSSLTSSSNNNNNNGDLPNNGYYWPALIYNNLVEVVRDLSPNEAPLLKAQLIMEYKKCPTRKVARLLGWDGMDGNDGQMKREIVLFAESRLELLRLSSSDAGNSNAPDETMKFYESLMDMEEMYHQLLLRATKETSSEKKKEVKQFVIRFGYALDMALNCMAMDIVGSEPILPRIYQEEDDQEAEDEVEGVKATSVCKTPNSSMVDSDVNTGASTNGNSRPSPAEDSMVSTAAVADGADFDNKNNFSEQHKSSTSIGTKRKKKLDEQPSDEINSGNDGAKAMSKKAAKSGKPPKSSANIDKAEGKKCVVAPTTTKLVIEKEVEEDTPKEFVHWKDVWATMKRCGWTWKGGSGLMTDYYYIKPKCKVQGGVSGIDYFVSVGETMEFARRTYGYDPDGMASMTREQLFSRIEEHAKYAGEVVPPLTADETLDPNGPWRNTWEVMLRSGWTWKSGSGLMMDYYYIKPGCKVAGGVEGQDYFVRVEDVQQFAMRNYGWRGNSVGVGGGAEDCGATRAQSRRTSSSDNGGTMREVPAGKRQRLEAKKPAAKEDVVVEAVTKSTKSAKPKIAYQESTEEDDDGMEDDEEETHSTFSQSGLQSKKLFSDECADEFIPPLAEDILGDETWSEAWKKMRDSGWKWTNGTGLMMDYFYIKPGCKVKGGVVGKDYFVLVEDVQRFAMRNYGWKGGNTTDVGKRKAVENKPSMQKNAVEEPSSSPRRTASPPTKKAASPLPPPPNPYEKKAQWQELQRNGWKAISAGRYNKLHDWYYVRPNCDPGDGESKLGVDFFLCEEDAIEAAKKFGNISSGTQKQRKEEEEEVEEEEDGQQQKIAIDEAPTSPIQSARKGTPAPPFSTPQGCRTKPQDPAIPLLSSPESCSPSSRYDMYEWHNLWPALERAGWRCIKAGKYNPLHNFYYVRPTRDPGDENCVLGQHYFDCQEDVISYVKREDDERGAKRGNARKSMGVMLGAFEEVADS